ncbi:hypothetical protein BD414DRAFT_511116 [Trametes punicea]|nr:hypothetical protein BD414DRAFT_511116 [Trametes punicea]
MCSRLPSGTSTGLAKRWWDLVWPSPGEFLTVGRVGSLSLPDCHFGARAPPESGLEYFMSSNTTTDATNSWIVTTEGDLSRHRQGEERCTTSQMVERPPIAGSKNERYGGAGNGQWSIPSTEGRAISSEGARDSHMAGFRRALSKGWHELEYMSLKRRLRSRIDRHFSLWSRRAEA